MIILTNPLIILLLFVAVRAGDIAVGATVARDTVRVVLYGIVALLALIAAVLIIIGIH